jgi:hypothetical protein
MPQCKATTATGNQCASPVVPPSRSLCKRHQNVLATGKTVINFETGRKFAVAAVAEATAATTQRRPRPQLLIAPARARAEISAPQRGRARQLLIAPAQSRLEISAPQRGPGEHPLTCDAPGCAKRALVGTNYCMQHQSLA